MPVAIGRAPTIYLDYAAVVAALQSRRIGMELLQVVQMLLGVLGRDAAVLAHVQLGAPLLVAEAELDLKISANKVEIFDIITNFLLYIIL